MCWERYLEHEMPQPSVKRASNPAQKVETPPAKPEPAPQKLQEPVVASTEDVTLLVA